MPVNRLDRVDSLLKRVIGEAMFRIMQGEDVSPGCVTVTGVSCARNLRNATVRISVFGDEAEKRRVLSRVVAKTHAFEHAINGEMHLKYTPRLSFSLDYSLEKGDEVLALLDRLERGRPAADPEGGASDGE